MAWFHKAAFSVKLLERQDSELVIESFKMLPLGSNENGHLQVLQYAFIFSTSISLTLFYHYNFWLKIINTTYREAQKRKKRSILVMYEGLYPN